MFKEAMDFVRGDKLFRNLSICYTRLDTFRIDTYLSRACTRKRCEVPGLRQIEAIIRTRVGCNACSLNPGWEECRPEITCTYISQHGASSHDVTQARLQWRLVSISSPWLFSKYEIRPT
jgi:hypothetical protein